MSVVFSELFKEQAVEKALSRSEGTSLGEVAKLLGVGRSTLSAWIVKAKNQTFSLSIRDNNRTMTAEKRPQDWTLEERLTLLCGCADLHEEALSEYCRGHGIYPHHVKQWKLDFINGTHDKTATPSALRLLKQENQLLKKELNRKDKALAETAALLVLQKKVQSIWGIDGDSSP